MILSMGLTQRRNTAQRYVVRKGSQVFTADHLRPEGEGFFLAKEVQEIIETVDLYDR